MEFANPYDKAHELARSITNDDIYLRYVTAKKEIEKNIEVKEKIIAFRNKQMEINQAQMLGQNVSDEKIKEVAIEYAKLNMNKTIEGYFNAEGMFIQMFNDIQQIIQKAIEQGLIE